MKRLILAVAVLLAAGAAAMAQTPGEMQYQLLVTNPQTGEIKAQKAVSIRMEVRKGGPAGTAVWAKDYSAETDKRGLCTLSLDFGDNVDWGNGTYYLATIIDGTECGAPKLTSVPYAMQAAALDGVMTSKELIGTWKGTSSRGSSESTSYTYTFNADGTGELNEILTYYSPGGGEGSSSSSSTTRYQFNWKLTKAGVLYWEGTVTYGKDNPSSFCRLTTMHKVDAGHLIICYDQDEGLHLTRQ